VRFRESDPNRASGQRIDKDSDHDILWVPRHQDHAREAAHALDAKTNLLRARDLAEQGLPTITLTRLVQAGKLDRVARGLYSLLVQR
jgi:hypothetical protein